MRRRMCGRSYLEIAADICEVPYPSLRPGFFPSAEEHAKAVELKKKVGDRCIGWAMSGSRPDKIYPYASVVIGRLIRDLGVPVILFGAPGRDEKIAELIETNIKIQHGRSLDGLHIALPNVANPWGLRASLAQLQMCDLVIGPDTGAMWAVAAEGMPKVMLLSHASAENITKHWVNTTSLQADQDRVPCYPCHRLHDSMEHCVENEWKSGAACISDITADRLYEAAASAWANTSVLAPRPQARSVVAMAMAMDGLGIRLPDFTKMASD
jgi:ADP-heptose:LPS heptosyltransferase